VMDHADYDKQNWIEDCGCHRPPPKRATSAKKTPAKRKPGKSRRKRRS
jgi:hypothetical protein